MAETHVYLESGSRRTFAGAIDWPGWCCSGRGEASALEALLFYGSRYARVLQAVHLDIDLPVGRSELAIVERLEGSSTTDFGAPAAVPAADSRPIDDEAFGWLATVLRACWRAFDSAAEAAADKSLRQGPRGGGRDLTGIFEHVVDANRAYLNKLAWKPAVHAEASPEAQMEQMLDEVLNALEAAVAGDLPGKGARRKAMGSPLLCAARRLARAGSRLGDRGSRGVMGSAEWNALPLSCNCRYAESQRRH